MASDQDNQSGFHPSPPTTWGQTPHIQPHSYHGTPVTEYHGFNFGTPQLPMEPSAFSSSIHQRPIMQPLVVPQAHLPWPSQLSSQAHSSYQPMYHQPVQPIQPDPMGQLQTPVSASSAKSTSTPRKTLTDADRKRMCQYAEEHPNSKQTEIGAIFGVERSTVSKVLRQKDKYLAQDEGSRSPAKRAKGRSPDIERTLAVWARNQEKKGVRLTDEIIRDQARVFAATTPEHQQMLSSSWLEKFKLKNNLMGARSRKSSLAPDDAEGISATASSSHSPSGTSPVSEGLASPELHSAQSQESLKNESPDSYSHFGRHGPFHSQSTTSLNSAFTDTAPSSFSPLHDSPFLTSPESGTAPGPFPDPPLTARLIPSSSASNSHRPRSQTFPIIEPMTSMTDAPMPKYVNAAMLDSPMGETSDPLLSLNEVARAQTADERTRTVTPAEMMRPPPLPAHIMASEPRREAAPPSAEEAQIALQKVMDFIQLQPTGFLDFQESMHMGKLMEKLKLQSRTAGS